MDEVKRRALLSLSTSPSACWIPFDFLLSWTAEQSMVLNVLPGHGGTQQKAAGGPLRSCPQFSASVKLGLQPMEKPGQNGAAGAPPVQGPMYYCPVPFLSQMGMALPGTPAEKRGHDCQHFRKLALPFTNPSAERQKPEDLALPVGLGCRGGSSHWRRLLDGWQTPLPPPPPTHPSFGLSY